MPVMNGSGSEMAERGVLNWLPVGPVASSINTRSVQASPLPSNHRCSAAVDLDQLAKCLAPQTRLVKGSALLA